MFILIPVLAILVALCALFALREARARAKLEGQAHALRVALRHQALYASYATGVPHAVRFHDTGAQVIDLAILQALSSKGELSPSEAQALRAALAANLELTQHLEASAITRTGLLAQLR